MTRMVMARSWFDRIAMEAKAIEIDTLVATVTPTMGTGDRGDSMNAWDEDEVCGENEGWKGLRGENMGKDCRESEVAYKNEPSLIAINVNMPLVPPSPTLLADHSSTRLSFKIIKHLPKFVFKYLLMDRKLSFKSSSPTPRKESERSWKLQTAQVPIKIPFATAYNDLHQHSPTTFIWKILSTKNSLPAIGRRDKFP